MRTIEAESIDVVFSGGLGRSSDESSVMEEERRARVKLPGLLTLNRCRDFDNVAKDENFISISIPNKIQIVISLIMGGL